MILCCISPIVFLEDNIQGPGCLHELVLLEINTYQWRMSESHGDPAMPSPPDRDPPGVNLPAV